MPRVTVGVPTYNRASYLTESIPLILGQNYSDFEIVICDDASLDNTHEVVRNFNDNRIRCYHNPQNLNIPKNLNRILELASGEFIIILHDHDRFDPSLLEKMVAFLEQHEEVGFVHCGIAWIDPDGSNYLDISPDFAELTHGNELIKHILMGNSFSSPISACGMVRRSAYEAVGFYYDEQFGFLSDVDMWLRLAAKFDVGYLKEPLITCRRREESHEFASTNWKLVDWIVNIHHVNIQRHLSKDNDTLNKALAHWRKKTSRYHLTTLLSAAANHDSSAMQAGFEYLSNFESGWLSGIAKKLKCHTVLHAPLMKVVQTANKMRKLVKNKSR